MFEDRILIRKSKHGDRGAFDAIYQKYLDVLLTVAVNLLGDFGLAEDAVQEVFVKFIQSLDTFELRGSLKSYLCCCVANRCRDWLRREKRRPSVSLHEQTPEGSASTEPVPLAIRGEQMRQLLRGLEGLPYEQREAVLLRHQGDMTFRAIAEAQGISLRTVQSRYAYGMEKLRSLLNGEMRP